MSDLIQAVRAKADVVRAIVVTRHFRFEGDIHTPKLGKDDRRLSNLLNTERMFIAMTNVKVLNLASGSTDPNLHKLVHINLHAVEYVLPYLDERELEREAQGMASDSQSRIS